MTASDVLTIHTDGASRGNPGAAAFAYVIARAGQPPVEEAGCLGRMTNNQAEYTALVRALEHAARLGTHHRVTVHSDSELLVKQMRGEYRVKDPGLRELYDEARELADRFEQPPRFVHVRRAQNARADELCNLALDGRLGSGEPEAVAEAPRPAAPDAANGSPALHDRAIACLRRAAAAWARGDAGAPAPVAIWDELLTILEEEGALRR
jgi:ribonuclease HI/probable phosphoglycerate mutase